MADHRSRYKNTGLDANELRRRREDNSVQLRKQKRDEFLSKKRTLAPVDLHDSNLEEDETDLLRNDTSDLDTNITPDMIENLMQNQDLTRVLDSAQRIRKILSKEPQPPFDDVIQAGCVPRFVQLLDLDAEPLIQFEVAWVLTNICSGTTEQTRVVVESGALPKLVGLLNSPDMRVKEQAVWALGNIVGDGADLRDLVIAHGFVPALLNLIQPDIELGFLRNATWVLVNLCRNKEPPTDIEVIKLLMPALLNLIQSDDQSILIDTTWAVSYITELGPSYSQLTIDSGIVNKMTPLLTHQETKIQAAAIRALGCITTGSDMQTQAVIDAGAIPHLRKLLSENKDKIVREALWFVSNISAGSQNQIQAVIDGGILPSIIYYLSVGDYQQQKEASWIIFNFCLSGTPEQMQRLVQERVIPPLCDLLGLTDLKVVRNVLDALTCLLKNCDDEENHTVRDLIESCGGLDKIESLQESKNGDVYSLAYSIIDNYFSE